MNRAWIRSSVFNVFFLAWTALCCVLYLPLYFAPRSILMFFVRIYLRGIHFLEVLILNLRYEVRGLEHLPEDGSYIVASKHQSPYETLKIHLLLNDPAVVLKQELLSIPFWGQYLKKADVIAIDRSSPDAAIQSIQDGALRVKKSGRPIFIFPQGTRVKPEETTQRKPYKIGVARIQEATDLPIIPLALNAGMFWPRTGWLKSSGTVIFEFLPRIDAGLKAPDLLKALEQTVETASSNLMNEAQESDQRKRFSFLGAAVFLVVLGLLYTALWFNASTSIKYYYKSFLQDHRLIERTPSAVSVSGFPALRIHIPHERIHFKNRGTAEIEDVTIQGWPLPFAPVDVSVGTISVQENIWVKPLVFKNTEAELSYRISAFTLHDMRLPGEDYSLNVDGVYTIKSQDLSGVVHIHHHITLLDNLKTIGALNERSIIWAKAGLSVFLQNGIAEVPITTRAHVVRVGPFPVMKLNGKSEEAVTNSRQPLRRQRVDIPAP